MTSSMASVAYGWRDGTRPDPLTEEHWTNPDYRPDNTGYTRSKVIAERAAWDYMAGEGAGMELACINPVLVLGPLTSPGFSASVEAVTQVMRGKMPATPKVGFQLVDVRDVADAHVSAMTVPEAAGERFIVGTEFLWYREVVDILREAFPAYAKKLPKGELPDFLVKGMSLVNPVLKQIIPELGKRRFATNEKARARAGLEPSLSQRGDPCQRRNADPARQDLKHFRQRLLPGAYALRPRRLGAQHRNSRERNNSKHESRSDQSLPAKIENPHQPRGNRMRLGVIWRCKQLSREDCI